MSTQLIYTQIQDIIAPAIDQAGLELIELNVKYSSHKLLIQLLLDHEQGGITVEECAVINKKIVNILEEQNLIPGDYLLEVSSPGLDRSLKTVRDFRRVTGRLVRFHLLEMMGNKCEYAGRVTQVADDGVVIAPMRTSGKKKIKEEKKEELITIPIAKIAKAVLVLP